MLKWLFRLSLSILCLMGLFWGAIDGLLFLPQGRQVIMYCLKGQVQDISWESLWLLPFQGLTGRDIDVQNDPNFKIFLNQIIIKPNYSNLFQHALNSFKDIQGVRGLSIINTLSLQAVQGDILVKTLESIHFKIQNLLLRQLLKQEYSLKIQQLELTADIVHAAMNVDGEMVIDSEHLDNSKAEFNISQGTVRIQEFPFIQFTDVKADITVDHESVRCLNGSTMILGQPLDFQFQVNFKDPSQNLFKSTLQLNLADFSPWLFLVGLSDWKMAGEIDFNVELRGAQWQPKGKLQAQNLYFFHVDWSSPLESRLFQIEIATQGWNIPRSEWTWMKDSFYMEAAGTFALRNWKVEGDLTLDDIQFLHKKIDIPVWGAVLLAVPFLRDVSIKEIKSHLIMNSKQVQFSDLFIDGDKALARAAGTIDWDGEVDMVARIVETANKDMSLIKKVIQAGLSIATIPVTGVHATGTLPDIDVKLDIPVSKLSLLGVIKKAESLLGIK